jgi:hypothetical protein
MDERLGARFYSEGSDTEIDEATLVIPNETLAVNVVEVLSAEFAVFDAVAKHVPHGDEDRMGNRNDGFLVATSFGQPTILRGQVAIALTNGTAGAFDQSRP